MRRSETVPELDGAIGVKPRSGLDLLLIPIIFLVCAFACAVAGLSTGEAGLSFSKIAVVAAAIALLVSCAIVFRGCKKYFINLIAGMVATWAVCIAAFLLYSIDNKPLFVMLFGFGLIICAAVFFAVSGQMSWSKAIMLLIAAAFVLRLGYILYTGVQGEGSHQHDVEGFVSGSHGHGGYILWFFENWKLPTENPYSPDAWQFYHPPLHHFLAAVWMKLQTICGISQENAQEGIQFLTLFYSMTSLVLAKRIFETLRLKGSGLFIAVAVVALGPAFVIFSGSVNNDILSITFALAAFLAALKWNDSDRLCHLLQVALFIGLGMATKTSAALVAVPMAVLMLVKFALSKKKLKTVGRYAAFAAVVFPLGLGWQIRNSLMFGVPFMQCFAVPRLSETSSQYVGGYSLMQRLLPFYGMGNTEFFRWGDVHEYNAFSGLFKSSAFGEYSPLRYGDGFDGKAALTFSPILFYLLLAVCILSFAAMVFYLVRKREDFSIEQKMFVGLFYATLLISYLSFCVSFPHTCTMNIRYASPLIVIGAFFLGKWFSEFAPLKSRGAALLSASIAVVTGGFCLFSVITYTLWCVPA